jgi:hypothetical protein
MKKDKQPLVITTAHRGVFFGYGMPTTNKTIRLENARMCVYWSSECKGIVGLAATGPTKTCKIGPAAPAITIQDVTAIFEATKEAEAMWNSQPWN